MPECERCRTMAGQMMALGRDVRALGAAWNRTRARLVAEVERLGRLEAALEDEELVVNAVGSCTCAFHAEDGCATGGIRSDGIEAYREALRTAMSGGGAT